MQIPRNLKGKNDYRSTSASPDPLSDAVPFDPRSHSLAPELLSCQHPVLATGDGVELMCLISIRRSLRHGTTVARFLARWSQLSTGDVLRVVLGVDKALVGHFLPEEGLAGEDEFADDVAGRHGDERVHRVIHRHLPCDLGTHPRAIE